MNIQEVIDNRLQEIINQCKNGIVKEAMNYSLLSPGKRLRPILLLKTIEAYNKDYLPYLDAACALEMIHAYSLIHDDLPAMDNDDLRRGQKTCHKQFDEATAILAGDALLTLAFSTLSSMNIAADKIVKCVKILSTCSGQNGMIYGQQQDIFYENNKATLEQLVDIHEHKTAMLFIAAFIMACTLIGREEDINAFKKIGWNIGICYQIQDDILDVVGDKLILGKNIGSDLSNDKSTYTTILGMHQASCLVEQHFQNALELLNQLDINQKVIVEIFETIIKRVK